MSNISLNQQAFDYYRNRRVNISEFIHKGSNRVLEVGCGAGNFGAYLKQYGYASEVVGIEINQQAADEALTKLDQVFCADLNRSIIDELLIPDTKLFDYIVCADVLEHLINPWQILGDLAAHLAPGGKVIASIPNVRHWSVWWPLLLRGGWDYQDAGIMDRTHLRFFTKSTMCQLLESANLNVVQMRPLIGGKWKLVDKYSLHLLRDFVAVQWVLVGTRKADNK